MPIRHTHQGSVVACEHRYTSRVTGKLKDVGGCEEKFVTFSVGLVVVEQAKHAGWEFARYSGGVQIFCPEHTRAAIAKREREKRERDRERIWR